MAVFDFVAFGYYPSSARPVSFWIHVYVNLRLVLQDARISGKPIREVFWERLDSNMNEQFDTLWYNAQDVSGGYELDPEDIATELLIGKNFYIRTIWDDVLPQKYDQKILY